MKRFAFMINKLQRNTMETPYTLFQKQGIILPTIISEQTIQYYVTIKPQIIEQNITTEN